VREVDRIAEIPNSLRQGTPEQEIKSLAVHLGAARGPDATEVNDRVVRPAEFACRPLTVSVAVSSPARKTLAGPRTNRRGPPRLCERAPGQLVWQSEA
jgi:hypothetical protein